MSAAVRAKPDWNQWEGEIVGGEFPLERFLGAGERGAVFRTRIGTGGGAIKLVPTGKDQADELVERWNRARTFDHPHLIKILATGTWTQAGVLLAYLVMEYADENLAAVLVERPLTADETLEMLQPAADALAFLHRQGLAHGRLKPSNIFAVEDTLKISIDAVAVGDVSADLRSVAATTIQVLTRQRVTFSTSPSETTLIYNLAPIFQEIVRNCAGQNGRAQWSAAELSRWLRSQSGAVESEAVRSSRARIGKPKLTRYAIVFALIAVATVTIGSLLTHRTAGSISGTSQPSATTEQAPSTSRPAPAKKKSPAMAKEVKANAPPREAAPRPVESAPRPVESAPRPIEAAPRPVESAPRPIEAAPRQVEAAPRQAIDAPDQVVHQVLPDVSTRAQRTVRGTAVFVVRVVVDQAGQVTDATLESGGSSSKYFGTLALEAARKWVFVARNTSAPQEWRLRFEITRTDMKVFPQKAAER